MLSVRKVKRIVKIVEKRLKKEYYDETYFYIDNLSLGLDHMAGLADIHCVCGYEKTGEYHQVDFTFDHVGIIRSNRECAAVLILHCIEALDDTSYFSEGRK